MGTRKTRKRCPDFYGSINDRWKKAIKLPPTESRTTLAYFLQEDINREIDTVIHKSIREGGPIAELVTSFDAAAGTIPVGLSSLIQVMMTMNSPTDIASRLGWMNRYSVSPPLLVYAQGDPRNHRRCRVFIEVGEPRIGIPEYWYWPEYTKIRQAYATYVRRLSSILGSPTMLMGYNAESEFAGVYPTKLQPRQRSMTVLSWSELCKEYKKIDWQTLLTAWGLSSDMLSGLTYCVTSPAFLHHFQNRVHRWNIQRWQGWFSLLVAQWVAGCSPHGPLRSAWFDYTNRFIQGALTDISPSALQSTVVRSLMPNTVGRLWVKEHCDPTLKRDVSTLVETIRSAAIAALKKTSWMELKTRDMAVRKLRKMRVDICWPEEDEWNLTEVSCTFSRTKLVDNMLSLGKLAADNNQKILKNGDCRHPYGKGWDKPVFDVNAYYFPDENRFILPAAILRPPFYDTKKSVVWNYGAIGATIGHEFCHAFDSDGRMYDENGDKRNWWTGNDSKEYEKKARRVVKLYDSTLYRGLKVNGELTLIENIADIGGLEFALAGARSAVGRTLTKAELRDFFTSFATSWRSKDRLKRAAQLLVTDMHSPPELRVNLVTQQMDEWYEAFDVDPTCDSWITPEERIHFFA